MVLSTILLHPFIIEQMLNIFSAVDGEGRKEVDGARRRMEGERGTCRIGDKIDFFFN